MDKLRKNKIKLDSVSKRFNIGYKDNQSVLARITNLFSGIENKKSLSALTDVSLEVKQGEIVGIIGRNGSGKSTLLRLIAGIYNPDNGRVYTEGQIMYINGFNHGTKPRLTMRENIFLAGSIMGLSKSDVKSQFENIVDFSGLREFVDTKVYQFSSGMITRLNFAIFINFVAKKKPDILLIDEVLGAGGDMDFNIRAQSKMAEFVKGGVTVILASHSLIDIQNYCEKVIWIDKGKMVEYGPVLDVITKYKAL